MKEYTTKDEITVPHSIMEYYRTVIDLYKKCFADYKAGLPVDESYITDVQRLINFAIDHAKVNNLPYEEFEALKNDIDHLKYDLV